MEKAMRSAVETITPQTALEMLKTNIGNRPVRSAVVKRLAGIIRRGEWEISHQGIAFDANGRLLDGQHRLLAISEAGIACAVMVTRNVPTKSFRVMDQGARRSLADLSGMSRRVVEGCALAAKIIHGTHPTFDQVEPILSSRIGSAMIDLIDHCGTSRRFYSSAPMKLGCVVIALRGDRDREHAFATYRALANFDFDAMPPIARALVRQEQNGLVHTSGKSLADSLARSLAVHDRLKRDLSRIQVSEANAAEALRATRDFLRDEVGIA